VVDGINSTSTEITDHQLTKEMLAKESAFYQAIIEQAAEGLCVCHEMPDCQNLEFTVWNKRMVEITGYTREEINRLERRQFVYADPERHESFVERIACVHSGQKLTGEEWKITRKDGQKRILSICTTFIGSDDEPVHVLGIVHDITEKKRAEEALKRYSERLETLVEERTEQLKNAERLSAIGETAAMVCHDLRNPLQSLFCMVYLAKERLNLGNVSHLEGQMSMEEILDNMKESVDYMSRIVSDIPDYARKLSLNLVKTDISFFIRETLSTVDIPDNVNVIIQVEGNPLELNIDLEKMKRVIINLATNSLNAMPGGGQMSISVRQSGDFVRISVKDNGAGIPEEILPRLFLPLFTTRSNGVGLGLLICKRMVDAMGGNIAINSRLGEGTEAVIEIPVR
jgi:PAS domain S-box-containing protein